MSHERMGHAQLEMHNPEKSYDLYEKGLDWTAIARRLGYAKGSAARLAAKIFARKNSKPWPPVANLAVLLICLLPLSAFADIMLSVPSTPDIAISGNTTAAITFPKAPLKGINWLWIKNDCAQPLYFDLTPTTGATGDYDLRLNQTETFTAQVGIRTLGVQNKSGVACTFTLAPAYVQ